MLEKIKIKNFQSHVDTEITLDPGINAITGSSDVGKSSIFRAINWLRLNRPIGSAFINHNAKGKPAEVSLTLDGTTVTRSKSKSKNEYHLNKKAFKVVGSDVPGEVSTFLNLNDISIQGQHDAYFLLQSSPGEVAKRLNKVAGFEIIDAVTKDVKSAITKNTADGDYYKEHLKELESEIKEYEHLNCVEGQLKSIQNDITKYTNTKEIFVDLSCTLGDIRNTEELLGITNDWLGIESLVNPILVDIEELINKTEDATQLEQIINDINTVRRHIGTLRSKASYEKNVEQILTDVKKFNVQYKALKSLVLVLENIKTQHLRVKELTSKITSFENEMATLLKDQKLCPLCGVKLTDDRIEHIQHWG